MLPDVTEAVTLAERAEQNWAAQRPLPTSLRGRGALVPCPSPPLAPQGSWKSGCLWIGGRSPASVVRPPGLTCAVPGRGQAPGVGGGPSCWWWRLWTCLDINLLGYLAGGVSTSDVGGLRR